MSVILSASSVNLTMLNFLTALTTISAPAFSFSLLDNFLTEENLAGYDLIIILNEKKNYIVSLSVPKIIYGHSSNARILPQNKREPAIIYASPKDIDDTVNSLSFLNRTKIISPMALDTGLFDQRNKFIFVAKDTEIEQVMLADNTLQEQLQTLILRQSGNKIICSQFNYFSKKILTHMYFGNSLPWKFMLKTHSRKATCLDLVHWLIVHFSSWTQILI